MEYNPPECIVAELTNGELGIILQNIDEKLSLLHTDNTCEHKRIQEQVTKTNGRVGRLEVRDGFITGGLALLGFMIVIGATIVVIL